MAMKLQHEFWQQAVRCENKGREGSLARAPRNKINARDGTLMMTLLNTGHGDDIPQVKERTRIAKITAQSRCLNVGASIAGARSHGRVCSDVTLDGSSHFMHSLTHSSDRESTRRVHQRLGKTMPKIGDLNQPHIPLTATLMYGEANPVSGPLKFQGQGHDARGIFGCQSPFSSPRKWPDSKLSYNQP
eukprot:gnl/MRDRNA2_/MRDRNA2_35156_c0_seq1.p1 gnl/MRDRNA2_/MRDRNA2_35156_c0~~gnl/MRDRNA2_/MRDRNA2_35156_c0_seq1.p1  ORF type:complete len:188 (+),score=20.02 gnl/MRDRNA2_/MRDRNA2_35156_c0_seq1:77-640(+)